VTDTSAVFPGAVGHTYSFCSVTRDNVELVPSTPDATTTITSDHWLSVEGYAVPGVCASGATVALNATASDEDAHGVAGWAWTDGGPAAPSPRAPISKAQLIPPPSIWDPGSLSSD